MKRTIAGIIVSVLWRRLEGVVVVDVDVVFVDCVVDGWLLVVMVVCVGCCGECCCCWWCL